MSKIQGFLHLDRTFLRIDRTTKSVRYICIRKVPKGKKYTLRISHQSTREIPRREF